MLRSRDYPEYSDHNNSSAAVLERHDPNVLGAIAGAKSTSCYRFAFLATILSNIPTRDGRLCAIGMREEIAIAGADEYNTLQRVSQRGTNNLE